MTRFNEQLNERVHEFAPKLQIMILNLLIPVKFNDIFENIFADFTSCP